MSERRFESNHIPDATRLPKCVTGWMQFSQGELFEDGTKLLTAVPICGIGDKWHYQYEVVTISCDEDFFNLEDANGDAWGWDLDDCDFYVELCK